MANLASVGSSFDHRPASVVFIDNRLQEHHQMFADPSVRYDSAVKKYVPSMSTEDDGTASMSRPVLTNINAMKFWEDILPKAMSELNSTAEPKDRYKTTYSIRDKTSWSDIYSSLEAARFKYENKEGAANKLREVRRKAASKIAPLEGVVRIASKVVPEGTCATPVLGSLQVLLDAVKIAARLREKVLESFDDNVSIFSDVELFLGTFPNDENIVNASVDLTVATLKGIELAIGFFISNSLVRGTKAFLTNNEYEKGLIESLDVIKAKSKSLMEEALKSHIYESHMYSQETQKLSRNVQTMSERVDKQLQNLGDGFNSMNQLLTEHVKEKDKMLEAARRQLEEAHRENHFLRAENNTLRAYSPFQGGSPYLPPQAQILAPQWYISQPNLRQVLNMFDVDLKDLAYVADKKGQFPPKQRLLAEQIVNTQPFRNWVVSPTSSKLLIHWDSRLPKVIAGVSPLSVFCMTITKALRAKERFLSMLWFCGRHVEAEESGGCVGGRAMITSLIDQLLRQHTFEVHLLSSTTINLSGLQEGNLNTLIELLCYLVRQLPPTVSVFFVIDNAAFFERDEFESDALKIFSILIRLSQDTSIPASIKVLFASTPGTTIIRSAFENEDLILNVEGLPQMVWAANEERVVRELEGGLS
ncbi:uncharacterized protein TRIVIDRAFT_48011 [Trichoderma virens Gv29-8]|uniref:Fungal STAND N-terminal Goodbye domain-containing protein n=1 Tax=Hypocrea virens (strain Gv29-8 / FGSC 10586) TaxID=413071 RepID=G9MZQ4_HYPVG|nr:uncharacterized protein TRIVIDRAFT_48011 [Trichoderma virens Gv29-8]EHK20110.1 hypothetical protein TRIVIDRAFT_48011 [Trichoderma virens Gv29-8]UKZ45948.1 hypothetical protein TrVGV298_000143 [Trichoderma virens]